MSGGNPFPQQPPGVNPTEAMPGGPPGKDTEKDACTMAMLAHLLGGIFGFIGPLIIWLIKKDEHPFVNDQGKEALNFQLTMVIAHIVAVIIAVASCGFLFFLPFITLLVQLIFGLIGMSQATKGIAYRYPICIRFIK